MAKIVETSIESLIPDNKNFNKGTEYGEHLMDESLRKFGLGRSILIDRNNRIIAGNKTTEKAADIGFEKVLIVETDGETLVAVKRKDIDLDSAKGRELALADNATGKANLEWDLSELATSADSFNFNPGDWGVSLEEYDVDPDSLDDGFDLPDGDKKPFQQMTFQLANSQADIVKSALEAMQNAAGFNKIETFGNTNSNGNALFEIVRQWAGQRK